MATITASLDWVNAHIKYAHFKLCLNEEELNEFKTLSLEEQEEWIFEEGDFIVDDYTINDFGDLNEIKIHE